MHHNELYYKSVDSTFLELERLHTIAPNSSYRIRAEVQTSGIGRKLNRWASPAGGLWYSFDLQYHRSVESFALYIGACIHRELISLFPSLEGELMIKWPNDIYYQNRKLAGILTRHYHHKNLYLVGFGVNVNNELIGDQELKAISLKEIFGFDLSVSMLAKAITSRVITDLSSLSLPENYIAHCERYLYGRGRDCRVDLGEETITGKVKGLTPSGNLLLEDQQEITYGSLSIL